MIREDFPDLLLCLSTNGLELVNRIDDLHRLGVNHITVTINTMNPELAAQIYSHVRIDGKRRSDMDAMSEFLQRQVAGIKAAIQAGMLVKANSILIPGLNDKELVSLSKRLKLMGVSLHNILPLIADPGIGSRFSEQGWQEPSHEDLESIRAECGITGQMTHCRQCRADAIGRLGEHPKTDDCSSFPEIPASNPESGPQQREQWRQTVRNKIQNQFHGLQTAGGCASKWGFSGKIAVCTQGFEIVDGDLKTNRELYIYKVHSRSIHLINVRRVDFEAGLDNNTLLEAVQGCRAVISPKFGYHTFKTLEAAGIQPISDLGDQPIELALEIVAERLSTGKQCPSQHNLSAVINH